GVDGIKTGYIKTSGFNLLTAARRGERHIVVAAIGSNTGAVRDRRVRELGQSHLPKGRAGSILEVANIPVPDRLGEIFVAAVDPVTPKPYPGFRDVEIRLASLAGSGSASLSSAADAAHMLGSGSADRQPPPPQAEVMGAWVGETHALTTNALAPADAEATVPAVPMTPLPAAAAP